MKSRGIIFAAALALSLAVTACASGTPTQSPELTSGPRPETLAPTPSTPNDRFLSEIKSEWKGRQPSDADFVSGGLFVCQELTAGVPGADIVAVEGSEDDAWNNDLLVRLSEEHLCEQ